MVTDVSHQAEQISRDVDPEYCGYRLTNVKKYDRHSNMAECDNGRSLQRKQLTTSSTNATWSRGSLSDCISDMPITLHHKNGQKNLLIFPLITDCESSLLVRSGKLAEKRADGGSPLKRLQIACISLESGRLEAHCTSVCEMTKMSCDLKIDKVHFVDFKNSIQIARTGAQSHKCRKSAWVLVCAV